MGTKEDLELIRDVVARAALGTVKHHEVSTALQAFERVEFEGYKQRRIAFSEACEKRLDAAAQETTEFERMQARTHRAGQVVSAEISPPLDGFECLRCFELHQARKADQAEELARLRGITCVRSDTPMIPEHSPRCPMREERARAWDEGFSTCEQQIGNGAVPPELLKNPHR